MAELASKYKEIKWRSEVFGLGVPEDKVMDEPASYNLDDGSEDSCVWGYGYSSSLRRHFTAIMCHMSTD
jgi:hypothetical protein